MKMKTHKRSGIAVVLAFLILISGTAFGVLQIVNGVRAYGELPSDKQIHHMEEYLELMENLQELLEDQETLEAIDVDSYLDGKLQSSDLTGYQEQDIRKFYKDILAKAEGSYLDRELARNSLIREIIYYRQSIPNPGQTRVYMRNMLILGGGAILISLVLFLVLIRKRTPKEDVQRNEL